MAIILSFTKAHSCMTLATDCVWQQIYLIWEDFEGNLMIRLISE